MLSALRRFNNRAYSVKAATALLAVTALLSNGLGLLRNLIFYRLIEPAQLDMYYASFRIPDFLLNLIIYGAVTSAFVPIVTELIANKQKERAWVVTNQLLSWITVLFILLALVLSLAMRPLMELIVPGFDAARFETTVWLSRLMLLQPIFFGWSFTVGGLLNSTRRFSSFALAPLLYNLSIITGGILASRYGIASITYAVIIGALLHFALQYSELRSTGFRWHFDFSWSKEVRDIFILMIPRSLSQGMGQLVLIVYTTLASTLQAGSIAIFSGMNDLQTTPTVIVANSLAAALFPSLSTYIAKQDWDAMNTSLTKAVRTALFILLPSIALALVLRAQIVRLYFGIGGASWPLTEMAIRTFAWFMIGIIPASLVVLLSRVFYGFKNTMTPMYISLFAGAVSIAVAFIGIKHYGGDVATLAIAESVLALVQCVLFIGVLYKHDQVRLNLRSLGPKVLSYLFASGLVALGSWATLRGVDYLYQYSEWLSTRIILGLFIQMILSALIGIGLYVGYSKLIHKEELQWLKRNRFTTNKP